MPCECPRCSHLVKTKTAFPPTFSWKRLRPVVVMGRQMRRSEGGLPNFIEYSEASLSIDRGALTQRPDIAQERSGGRDDGARMGLELRRGAMMDPGRVRSVGEPVRPPRATCDPRFGVPRPEPPGLAGGGYAVVTSGESPRSDLKCAIRAGAGLSHRPWLAPGMDLAHRGGTHRRPATNPPNGANAIFGQALHVVDEPVEIPAELQQEQRRRLQPQPQALRPALAEVHWRALDLDVAGLPSTEVESLLRHLVWALDESRRHGIQVIVNQAACLCGSIEQTAAVSVAVVEKLPGGIVALPAKKCVKRAAQISVE